MTHRFPLKEIARQSGLGTATVDRVINHRAHVSPQTRARVLAAIDELSRQEAQLSARGRRMFFDFVIEAPTRFSREVRAAVEAILPEVTSAVCRPRFLMQEVMNPDEVSTALRRIVKRGSQGVCLKARDLPAIRESVDLLVNAGIPVVTLVTDLTGSARLAYVGLDNQTAGRTAAYLMGQMLGTRAGSVLTTTSNTRFLGEEERQTAFTQSLASLCPNLRIVDASGGSGIAYETARAVGDVIDKLGDICAVYSMGGGNQTITQLLDRNNLRPHIFIAHDLDQDNRALLQSGQINFVLHHDLYQDMHNVFRAFLHHHKLGPACAERMLTNIQLVTPANLPS